MCSLLGEAMGGGGGLVAMVRRKTTTFNFPREIIYSCLYWALLKGKKEDRERKLLTGRNNMLLWYKRMAGHRIQNGRALLFSHRTN